MTKREYLEGKGYHETLFIDSYFKEIKFNNSKFVIRVFVERFKTFHLQFHYITTQKDMDNLQIAFNNVKRDFEEMMKYED